jgi:hypothetical protein
LIEAFLEEDRFILAGLVGQLDDAHLGPRPRAPLLPVEHDRRKPPGRGALSNRAGELGEARHPKAAQNRSIGVERMAGEEEADCLELAAQPLGERPAFDLEAGERI